MRTICVIVAVTFLSIIGGMAIEDPFSPGQIPEIEKSMEQKLAENAFFTLTETILATVEDERAGETPPVKLSFIEINALIKTIQGTDPMAAINFSLELLALDAELKRFDILWWDKAATHTIQE